jgi:regulator of chromosome condensation
VYVFGEGIQGELGLGQARGVKRPRLSPNLSAGSVGVVQIATGGMRCTALTHDNEILTWGGGGLNDLGALGRDTTWDGGLVDLENEGDAESGSDEGELNPPEVTPMRKDIVDIGAGSHHSFAIHKNGTVYSWGLNSFGQTGASDGAGESHAVTPHPAVVSGLKGHCRVT